MTMPSMSRRSLLTALLAACATSLLPAARRAVAEASEFRPYRLDVPDEALVDLRARLRATRWPDRETVADQPQGVPLATMQKLAGFWLTDLDWRKAEARMNALPQFTTRIDGLEIHFIHVRSKHRDAVPVIIAHGWPGSIIERLKVTDPRTDPTGSGGSTLDAFDVVIPSLPAYGFSGRPTATCPDSLRNAHAGIALMQRLGYMRFLVQGGVAADARHPDERFDFLDKQSLSYAEERQNRPQTLYGIGDSDFAPAGRLDDRA